MGKRKTIIAVSIRKFEKFLSLCVFGFQLWSQPDPRHIIFLYLLRRKYLEKKSREKKTAYPFIQALPREKFGSPSNTIPLYLTSLLSCCSGIVSYLAKDKDGVDHGKNIATKCTKSTKNFVFYVLFVAIISILDEEMMAGD
jgi:hypothetical protein